LSCFYLKYRYVYISKHDVSETAFYLRLQVKLTQLDPIDIKKSLQLLPQDGDRIQSKKRCDLKYKQDGVLVKNRTINIAQKSNIFINVRSSPNLDRVSTKYFASFSYQLVSEYSNNCA
jgi:hypothetical protein